LPTGIKWLLIVNAAVFVLELFDRSRYLISYFGLTPNDVLTGPLLYQVGTYMFLHSPHSILHMLFNMLMLWMFGSELERLWGTRKFLKYYMITGIAAGVFTVIMTPHSMVPVIGASGAVLAVLVAFAVLWPNRTVLLWFLIPIKVKYLMMFIVGLDLIVVLAGSSDGVAHWTHLGGVMSGLIYMRGAGIPRFLGSRLRRVSSHRRNRKEEKERQETGKLMDEVDRILDKISEVGIDKLTDKERKTLERASSQLSRKRK
jgi:membrane associated rhomboid family serine protease